MISTPKGIRLHIAIFGRRNVGKSSLMNALTGQNVSLVSKSAGTTTDPVEKPMELLPFGPVLFIDTAGIDDKGSLGELRVKKTEKIFERADAAILVIEPNKWTKYEENLSTHLKNQKIPYLVAINKTDISEPIDEIIEKIKNIPYISISCTNSTNILDLKKLLQKILPENFFSKNTIVGDIVHAGDLAVLVVPIDLEAPKGRIILPQQQVIRDLLDNDAFSMIVKERELSYALSCLKGKPKLVICDSQVVLKVTGDTPNNVLTTTFSILFARFKGDLEKFVRGVKKIDELTEDSRVLIAEACTHHSIADDIGRVKIPRWIRQYTGKEPVIDVASGMDFPVDLQDYDLVIHCGGCMLNRTQVLSRISMTEKVFVPITNYGVAISFLHGVLERVLRPFPYIHEVFLSSDKQKI